jgi:hypothetical protein
MYVESFHHHHGISLLELPVADKSDILGSLEDCFDAARTRGSKFGSGVPRK